MTNQQPKVNTTNQDPYLQYLEALRKLNPFAPLNASQLSFFKIGSIATFILAYIYSRTVFSFDHSQTLNWFPLSIALIALVEFLCFQLKRPFSSIENKVETVLFLVITLVLSYAHGMWISFSYYLLEFLSFLAIHVSFVFYVRARGGLLIQGRLGILFILDGIKGFFQVPFGNFAMLFSILGQKRQEATTPQDTQAKHHRLRQIPLIIVSCFVAFILVVFAINQLSQASESFAGLAHAFKELAQAFLDTFFAFLGDFISLGHLILAIPIAMWLYGLIAGSLLKKRDAIDHYAAFQASLKPIRVFPSFTAYIIIGSLCLTYALFFIAGIEEFASLLTESISAHQASTIAVDSFWQLVSVSMLNFAVLGAFYLFSKKPLWDKKGTRFAATLLFVFTTLLALLAAWKLFGIYIFLYGLTPLRLISGWFITVLICWSALALVRFYKSFQAIRIGLFYALISFVALCYLYPFLSLNY